MAETYRYRRSDFKPLPVKLEHLDIELNFVGHEVHATNTLRMTAREPITELRLDARELDVHSVEWVGGGIFPLSYEDRREAHALGVRLPRRLAAGETFSIRTRTTCVPSDNVLEGIYKDTTPPGGPQQYISQCEQWGFQRIMPVLDDCTAKCTMVTTIEADARYTHLISNGNISRSRNPLGRPVLNPGDPSRQVITYENPIPMAPYLFIVAVGMWDMVEDVVVYPSGRRVKIEYLVPPGRAAGALLPLKILKDSMLWQNRTQEYEYRYDVYRTICMDKSNFGGMENVGNTTIVTAAALIDEFTNDARLEYAYNVIIHEFEHNQCGSDVTMATPFDMWLNEAFTVDVERQYSATQFDPACVRLDDVDAMRAPIGGPLAIEDAGHMGQIVREGFNDPDELVDGVTYVKAAEVIRMLRLILGEARFRKRRICTSAAMTAAMPAPTSSSPASRKPAERTCLSSGASGSIRSDTRTSKPTMRMTRTPDRSGSSSPRGGSVAAACSTCRSRSRPSTRRAATFRGPRASSNCMARRPAAPRRAKSRSSARANPRSCPSTATRRSTAPSSTGRPPRTDWRSRCVLTRTRSTASRPCAVLPIRSGSA
jgi:aminopeptidase N